MKKRIKAALKQFANWMEHANGYGPFVAVAAMFPLCVVAGAVEAIRDDWWPEIRRKWSNRRQVRRA